MNTFPKERCRYLLYSRFNRWWWFIHNWILKEKICDSLFWGGNCSCFHHASNASFFVLLTRRLFYSGWIIIRKLAEILLVSFCDLVDLRLFIDCPNELSIAFLALIALHTYSALHTIDAHPTFITALTWKAMTFLHYLVGARSIAYWIIRQDPYALMPAAWVFARGTWVLLAHFRRVLFYNLLDLLFVYWLVVLIDYNNWSLITLVTTIVPTRWKMTCIRRTINIIQRFIIVATLLHNTGFAGVAHQVCLLVLVKVHIATHELDHLLILRLWHVNGAMFRFGLVIHYFDQFLHFIINL